MKLQLISAGKSAVQSGQVSADLFIDCRGMVNPYRDPILGGKTGDDPAVQAWIHDNNSDYIDGSIMLIDTALQTRLTRNSGKRNPDGPLTVCFFCLAGVHRSRGLKNVIADYYKANSPTVEVEVL